MDDVFHSLMDGRERVDRERVRRERKRKRDNVVWCLQVRGEELDSMTQGNQVKGVMKEIN